MGSKGSAPLLYRSRRSGRLNLWAPFRSAGIEARPVVLLWGHGVREWSLDEQVRVVEGVPVISGHALRDWMRDRSAMALDAGEVTHVLDALMAQVGRRDLADQRRIAMPRSAGEVLAAGGQLVGGAPSAWSRVRTSSPGSAWAGVPSPRLSSRLWQCCP